MTDKRIRKQTPDAANGAPGEVVYDEAGHVTVQSGRETSLH